MTGMLRLSAVLTLIALALMLWSMFVPTPMPIMIAMTVGQVLGTTAFVIFGVAVVRDIRRSVIRRRRESTRPPFLGGPDEPPSAPPRLQAPP